MKFTNTFMAVLAFLAAIACSAARAADPMHIVFSTDTRGLLGPCPKCSGDPLQGGLPKRSTLVSATRAKTKSMLLVDAGNSLFGEETIVAGPKIIVDAYDAMGYDAINIAYEDFRAGRDVTLAALSSARLVPISANLLDDSTGRPLFAPFVIKGVGGVKVAIVGITEPPAAPDLPHLKRQLAGVRVDPLDRSLAAAVAKAKAEAPVLVLLYHGSAAGLASIQKQFGNDFAAILVGGTAPGEVPASGNLFVAFGNGRSLMDVAIDSGVTAKGAPLDVTSSLKPDPTVQKLVEDYAVQRDQLVQLTVVSAPTGLAKIPDKPAAEKLQPNVLQKSELAGRNSAVELRLTSVALLDRYGDAPSPQGKRWLAIGTKWTNLQPARPIEGKFVPVQYLVPSLSDNLYVVADASRVLPRAKVDAAGLLSSGALQIENQGDAVSGTLLCAVPRDSLPRQITLRFYDFAHGNIFLPLVGALDAPAEKPFAGPVRNEVIEIAAYGLKKLDEFSGAKAPEGMTFLSVDLRGRSTIVLESEASGLTPGAKRGQKLRVGSVADWSESRKYLQVVADGVHAYFPIESSDFPSEPRFLPDLMSGGNAVFLVPASTRSLAMRCDFPNAAVPGQSQPIRPKGLTLALEGRVPSIPQHKQVVAMEDDPFKITIFGTQSPAMFAGQKAPADRRFVSLQVFVENAGKNGEFFQTKQQLKYATEGGESLAYDSLSLAGPHPPAEVMWIPAGEKRIFDLVYSVSLKETRPRLAFTGASSAKVLDLPALAAMQAVPEPASAPTVQAPETATPQKPVAPAVPAESHPAEQALAEKQDPPPDVNPDTTAKANPIVPPARPLDIVRPNRTPRGLAGVGLTPEQVNAAIDKGSTALWKAVAKEFDGKRSERTDPLVCLALVHSGIHKKFPEFNTALRVYLTEVEPREIGTYQAGLLAMLIESYGDPSFLPKLRQTTRYLLEAQGEEGSWTYNVNVPEELFVQPAQTQALQVSGGTPLEGAGSASEPWKRLTDWAKGEDGDNSVSQFALLGLNAASRSGIALPPATWQRSLATTRKRSCSGGGWSYTSGGSPYGSMTCAGVCATAICRHELGEKEPADDPSIAAGITWLAKNFSVEKNPESDDWVNYYLYSLERVGRILDTEFIGDHEWYPLGASRLVSTQPANGLWVADGEERDPRLATSFALLFLTRATPTLSSLQKRGGNGTLIATSTVPSVMRLYVIMDCSGSMLEPMQGKMKIEHSQDAVAALIEQLPPGTEFGLRAYGHRKRAIERGADEDTELVIPMETLDKKKAVATVRNLRARGRTPMAKSLEEAVGDIKTDKPVTVILLTDGGEDTHPRRDPVKAAALFGAMSNVRFHIVGFDINQEDWTQSLLAMAKAGHAHYWPAAEAASLIQQMRSAVFGVPDDYVVTDAKAQPVLHGKFGESRTLPEGKYLFRAEYGGQTFEKEFWINTDATTAISFDASKAPASATASTAPPTTQVPDPVAPAPSRFCSSCGKPLKVGDKFCGECGAKVD